MAVTTRVVHLDGGGSGQVSRITLKNNIFHDSYNNDLVKINNSISDITVSGNIFYNQNGSDEHIDINSAKEPRRQQSRKRKYRTVR